MHELSEHPLEVGERVCSVAADLFDEGVDDRAAPAGVLAADEHPVLVAELCCKKLLQEARLFVESF